MARRDWEGVAAAVMGADGTLHIEKAEGGRKRRSFIEDEDAPIARRGAPRGSFDGQLFDRRPGDDE